MKYSIEIVKEKSQFFFFYTAQNVLLTLLPFHFYFPPCPQFYHFPSSIFVIPSSTTLLLSLLNVLFLPWRMQITMHKGEQQ